MKKTENPNPQKESGIDIDAEIHDVKTPLTGVKLKVQLLIRQMKHLPQQAPFLLIIKLLDEIDKGLDDLDIKLNKLREKLMKRK